MYGSHAKFFLALATLAALGSFPEWTWAAPPRVIRAVPDNGDIHVDPTTAQLRITFDQPMDPGGRSIVGGGDSFPQIAGDPRWMSGGRTFVVPVRLQANHVYLLSINNARFDNFRNREGEPARPHPMVFRTGPAAGAPQLERNESHAYAVEAARNAVDNYYSYRDRLQMNWNDRFDDAEDALSRAGSPQEFAELLGVMLAKAQDKHIWLTAAGQQVASYVAPSVPNANFQLLPQLVPNWTLHGRRIATGSWDDGVAYMLIDAWSPDGVAHALPAALAAVSDAKRLIIDVRGNGGGDERLARQVAGCFTDERVLYGKHVVRDPRSDGEFSPVRERWLEPNPEGPRIRARVAVLTGPVVMSSCESFLLMMKETGATLIGGRSQGSSGNPRPHDLGNGVELFLPSWKDMTADGEELEGVGVAPDIEVEAGPQDFQQRDPVLEAALKWIRQDETETQ